MTRRNSRLSPQDRDGAASEGGRTPPTDPPPRLNTPAPWMPGRLTLDELLGPLPVTWGEDPLAFAELQRRLSDVFKPFNVIEHGLVRDLVFWSAQRDRFHRWGWLLWRDLRVQGLRVALKDLLDGQRIAALADGCLRGDPAILAEAERELASLGLTFAHVTATAAATSPECAQFTRAAGECERQMDNVWRRIDRSRSVRDRAQRFVSERFRRERAEDEKTRQAELKGLRESLLKGRPAHPAALRSWPGPVAARPVNVEGGDGPDASAQPGDGPFLVGFPEASFERPDWVAGYSQLMDLLPLAGEGGDADGAYLYYLYTLSTHPADVLEERFVRSAVQARREQDQLQLHAVDLVGAALSTTLLETLRRLAPDADPGDLMARYRSDPDARKRVEEILAPSGLTLAQLEARGVLRDIKIISGLQRRLIEAQERSIRVDKALEERRAAASMRPRSSVERLGDRS